MHPNSMVYHHVFVVGDSLNDEENFNHFVSGKYCSVKYVSSLHSLLTRNRVFGLNVECEM